MDSSVWTYLSASKTLVRVLSIFEFGNKFDDCDCLLFRLGIRTLVLEQAESLRTGGTSLTLFKNGWKALDAIGVGNDLRTQFLEIQGYVVSLVLFAHSFCSSI